MGNQGQIPGQRLTGDQDIVWTDQVSGRGKDRANLRGDTCILAVEVDDFEIQVIHGLNCPGRAAPFECSEVQLIQDDGRHTDFRCVMLAKSSDNLCVSIQNSENSIGIEQPAHYRSSNSGRSCIGNSSSVARIKSSSSLPCFLCQASNHAQSLEIGSRMIFLP